MRSTLANSTCPIEFARLLLACSADEEKQSQINRLADFHALHAKESPAMLKRLRQAVTENRNVFAVAEIGAWLPASWCQMPTNRRRAIPQSLLAASAPPPPIQLQHRSQFKSTALFCSACRGFSRRHCRPSQHRDVVLVVGDVQCVGQRALGLRKAVHAHVNALRQVLQHGRHGPGIGALHLGGVLQAVQPVQDIVQRLDLGAICYGDSC